MKTLAILSSVFALGSLVALGQTTAAPRSTGQVSIRAVVKTAKPEKKDRNRKDKDDAHKPKPETSTKSLEVELSASKTLTGPVKMVTTWYARDQVSKDTVVETTADTEVALDAQNSAKVTVPEVSFNSVPSYSQKNGDRVPPSGHTYAGWVIRVYKGDTLVGEEASSKPLLKGEEK